jgi:hypothetical protein
MNDCAIFSRPDSFPVNKTGERLARERKRARTRSAHVFDFVVSKMRADGRTTTIAVESLILIGAQLMCRQ